MAGRDMQGFPVRSELDAKLRRSALDLQAMVAAAIAAEKIAPRTIPPGETADLTAARAEASARSKRGARSPGSLQARSCTVREKKRTSGLSTSPSP